MKEMNGWAEFPQMKLEPAEAMKTAECDVRGFWCHCLQKDYCISEIRLDFFFKQILLVYGMWNRILKF